MSAAAAPTGAVAGLPLAALVLARRVRALVAATVVHTLVVAVVAWWAGDGPTLPGVAALAAHLAVSLGAALPVRWQFAGDPARRERRAVRA
ncbi:MAG TPA: cobalt transporter, partial [Actinomycetospora sp.]|nr:cobalt transporter [Actinomycetospora sp.]